MAPFGPPRDQKRSLKPQEGIKNVPLRRFREQKRPRNGHAGSSSAHSAHQDDRGIQLQRNDLGLKTPVPRALAEALFGPKPAPILPIGPATCP